MTDPKTQAGETIRRQVMGDAYVDRARANASEFSLPLQDFINEHLGGKL